MFIKTNTGMNAGGHKCAPENGFQSDEGNRQLKPTITSNSSLSNIEIDIPPGLPPMGPARKSLCMAEKELQSSSSQGQGSSAIDEDKKALLVLVLMLKPKIEAFLSDQGFVPPNFDKDDPPLYEKVRCTQTICATQANDV
ncbi:MAG: hypothetical protein EZS28_022292 [Streblomastix strix]|uniref:Uncharacterized protein n=1 Tax=Streblomastix strix TaxID=222440 RepID=A0A5J4VHV4_9EUKA|nr:MAG: hypothetical protein EZS28_022292 [Streblomastix strix]